MPTAKNEVKLKFGTKANYTSATKNADTVYFITDTNQIFVGSSLVSSKCYYVTASPVSSNYGIGDVVVWKLSDNAANICVVNSSGQFDTFTISIPTDEITANTNARHSHSNKSILDKITGIVTKDNVTKPTNTTDLVDYSGFKAGSDAILKNTVHITDAQNLTDTQKTQARTNIGALGKVVPNPTNDNDAANKAYVDSKVASGGVTVDPSMSNTSVNPVQNKVIKKYIDDNDNIKVTITRTGDTEPYSYQSDKEYNYVLSQINKGCNAYAYCTWNKRILPLYQISDSTSSIVFRQYTTKYGTLLFLNSSNEVEFDQLENKILTYKQQALSEEDKLQSRTNIDVMSSQEVEQALNKKSSVTIKSWTADDVGGVDVTLSAGTTILIDSNSIEKILTELTGTNEKVVIEIPDATVSANKGSKGLSDDDSYYIGYGYNLTGNPTIYVSKFDPSNLLGSIMGTVNYTYPYFIYSVNKDSGEEYKTAHTSISSSSNINNLVVKTNSDLTVSSQENKLITLNV